MNETSEQAKDVFNECYKLMGRKNSDYGDSWRYMTQLGIADQIVVKAHRLQTILINDGKTLVSEGVESELRDIINYCVFGLIKIREGEKEDGPEVKFYTPY